MIQIVEGALFSGAALAAVTTIHASVAPQWRRIVRLASGHAEQPFAPLSDLVLAERRIAVRRWSVNSRPAPSAWRAAA